MEIRINGDLFLIKGTIQESNSKNIIHFQNHVTRMQTPSQLKTIQSPLKLSLENGAGVNVPNVTPKPLTVAITANDTSTSCIRTPPERAISVNLNPIMGWRGPTDKFLHFIGVMARYGHPNYRSLKDVLHQPDDLMLKLLQTRRATPENKSILLFSDKPTGDVKHSLSISEGQAPTILVLQVGGESDIERNTEESRDS